MKTKIILTALFLYGILFSGLAFADVVFSDGFEAGFTEWTGNDELWTTKSTTSETGVHGGLKRAQATGNTEPGDDVLVKNISTQNLQNIKLEFWYRIYKGLEDEDHVYIEWTADGSSWEILKDFTAVGDSAVWEYASYNLPAGAENSQNFAIRFRARLGASTSDIFYLDDVAISADGATVATPTPTPEPTAEMSTPSPTPSPISTPSPTLSPTPRATPRALISSTHTPFQSSTPTPLPTVVAISPSTSVAPAKVSAPVVVKDAEEKVEEELVVESGELNSNITSAGSFASSKSLWLIGLMIAGVVFSQARMKKD